MVSFGRRNNKLETLSKPSRYASTPLDAPGNLYTSRRRDEVDADGDLDDLVQQEIQRYEELFQTNNGMGPGLADDDTLLDGSIYTSMQGTLLVPATNKQEPQDDDEDGTMWGLENHTITQPRKPAATSLLNKEETVAAKACNVIKPKSNKKLFVPPVAAIPVDELKSKGTATENESKKGEVPSPVPPKKSKSKFFSKRLLGKSNTTAKKPVTSTPQTEASTPATAAAPKIKLFSPVRLLKRSKSFKLKKQQAPKPVHQNLLLASMATGKQNLANAQLEAPPPEQCQVVEHRMCPPSPPPPIETCEFRFGDGASVGSAQSSLTDALDAWMVKSSPPKIIGGNHLNEQISPYQTEAYEGGLTPYLDSSKGIINNVEEEASAGSPGALLMTTDGLYFHNHHGQALSPVRPPWVSDQNAEEADGDLVERVWTDKEEREDAAPEDSSNERLKILALKENSPDQEERSNDVKRNLFGACEDDNVEASSLLRRAISRDQEDEEEDESVSKHEDVPEASQEVVNVSVDNSHKASKFKKFLNKLVITPKSKQSQQEPQRQNEQEKAKEAQPILDDEETKRIEQMKQQEFERQRELERQGKLEVESQNPASNTESTESATSDSHSAAKCPARSFSLMTGDMKSEQAASQSSTTADVTSNPTIQSAPSSSLTCFETPRPGYSPDMLIQATPSSSYLVNFQFHRQEGDKIFTMAYSVDSSLHEDIMWKDIVNQAWKEDRRVVKSGVFSAIQADSIAQIQQGELEMRFELPFWGKHASQTMGSKTLDLLLDVVGPQRPVQVTITLEEPQVAAGVGDDGAPAGLF